MKLLTVAKYTFKELLKSKVVVASLWMGLIVLVLTYVTSEFSYGNTTKIAMDFGLGASSLVSIVISIFMGVSLISDEIESRTIYLSLSRPISRSQFLGGKILGMSLILLLNILIVNFFSISIYLFFGGALTAYFFVALAFTFLESLTLLLIVIMFSLITNKALTIINSIIIFMIGHGVNDTLSASFLNDKEFLSAFIQFAGRVLPNFDKINFKNHILYNITIEPKEVLWPFVYIVSYIGIITIINLLIFNKKELE